MGYALALLAGVVTAASLVNIFFEYRKITQLLDLVEVRPPSPSHAKQLASWIGGYLRGRGLDVSPTQNKDVISKLSWRWTIFYHDMM